MKEGKYESGKNCHCMDEFSETQKEKKNAHERTWNQLKNGVLKKVIA